MKDRLFRGDDRERDGARRPAFDPITEGARRGLSPEVSLDLWERARSEATDHNGRCDEGRARARFVKLAKQLEQQLGIAPFKWTQVDVASGAVRVGNAPGPSVPGRTTQVLARTSERARVRLTKVPSKTTLIADQADSDVYTLEEARAFFRRYVSGAHAARAKLESAIASRDKYAAVMATLSLRQDVASARRHLAGELGQDEALRRELAELGALTERSVATMPAEWSAAVGLPTPDFEEAPATEESPMSRIEQVSAAEPIEATRKRDEPITNERPEIEVPRETDQRRDRSSPEPLIAPKLPPLHDPSAGAWMSDQTRAGVARSGEPREPMRVPARTLERMERAFGQRFDDVEIHADSPEVPAGQLAFTRAQRIYLEPRAVDLETGLGERVLAHELAHIVQQRGSGERPGTRQELEREATRAAALASQGQIARIALRAQPAAAYGFNEGADHDDDAATASTADAGAGDPASTHADADRDKSAKHDDAAHASAGEATASHGDPSGETSDVQLFDVSAVVPAKESPAVAPGGGGHAGSTKQPKQPPNVTTAKPEYGLGQLGGVQPDKLGPALGQIHGAAGADIARTRAAQRANPPKQMSTGAALGPKPAGSEAKAPHGSAPKAAEPKDPAPKDAHPAAAAATAQNPAEHPVKIAVPEAQAAKQAAQGAAVEQQKAAGEVITSVAHTIASWFSSWAGAWSGHANEASAGKMSDEQSRQMAGSVDKIPTTADSVSTDAEPAPEIAMRSEAKASADRDRAAFDTKTAALETQSRAASRTPMGEDDIEPTAPPEELTAMSLVAGTPAATLPTLASAPSEEVGIVAQEQHGAEVDAALAKASADVTAERAKHADQEAQARADSDAQLRELKGKADADQAAVGAAAQAEVQTARAQWQSEIDKKGADARKAADRKVAEGMAHVEAEETKANAEAKHHVEEGKRKAEDEKRKGEKEAADAKEKAKHKSSGFWGWVASKAKAAFDGVKKAVSSAIDACRRAVKAVIEGAKKLAMAAIDLARKVINAAINAIGQALIAISDVLLAAFPELKARFQGAIRKTVDKAIATVNKLADQLKQAVQKALDQLGAALDRALQLLEKGINAIVDAVGAVVQGAIKAAQALVEMLGTWAKLIKDVATGPGAWIKKLGAAIVDGIKNHLWSAFKTAVIDWFKAKVFELLGIGGVILQLLLDGGLTKEAITQMALDALMVAIPAALVAILIEKLVSMIVPAAGALMAIIEGLQAAWGTISRIIAALSAFMAFLLAVKGGTAGALFAAVLASAAVVVLDFVANWLLKKLASAARKVGAKLKGLAEKFKRKRKSHAGQSDHHGNHEPFRHPDQHGAKPPSHHDEHEAKPPTASKHDTQEKPKKHEEDARKRVADAARAIRPKLAALIAKQPSKLRVRGQLAVWKLRYRLTELRLESHGKRVEFIAKVNPEENVGKAEVLPLGEELKQAESPRTGFYFRGDDEWRPGDSVGTPLTEETPLPEAEEIIDHVHPKSKDKKKRTARGDDDIGGPTKTFVSFSEILGNKSAGAAKFTKMNRISRVAHAALDHLVAEGKLRILTPDDVEKIIAAHRRPKIQAEARNVRDTMARNHEVLIQGLVPGDLLTPAKSS